jgi:tetratricopeptide (TPR) repeat protein
MPAAQAALVEALDLLRGRDPGKTRAPIQAKLARTVTNYATLLADLDRGAEAIQQYQEAIGIYRSLPNESGPEVAELAQAFYNLALALKKAQRIEEARRAFGEALNLVRRLNEISKGAHAKLLELIQKQLAAIVVERLAKHAKG